MKVIMMMIMTTLLTSPEEGPSRGWLSRSPISPLSRPDDDYHEEEVNHEEDYDQIGVVDAVDVVDKDDGDDDDDPT